MHFLVRPFVVTFGTHFTCAVNREFGGRYLDMTDLGQQQKGERKSKIHCGKMNCSIMSDSVEIMDPWTSA